MEPHQSDSKKGDSAARKTCVVNKMSPLLGVAQCERDLFMCMLSVCVCVCVKEGGNQLYSQRHVI